MNRIPKLTIRPEGQVMKSFKDRVLEVLREEQAKQAAESARQAVHKLSQSKNKKTKDHIIANG